MPNHGPLPSHRLCGWSRHARRVPSFHVYMVVRCKEVIPALAVHAGTAEPLRVSPPEAVAYPLELKITPLIYLLYLSLLTPVVSPNPLLYQSLPTSIHDWQAIGRRRKDDTHVGTAARGMVA